MSERLRERRAKRRRAASPPTPAAHGPDSRVHAARRLRRGGRRHERALRVTRDSRWIRRRNTMRRSAPPSAQQNASRPGAVSPARTAERSSRSRARRIGRLRARGPPSAATGATRSADDLGACRVISPASEWRSGGRPKKHGNARRKRTRMPEGLCLCAIETRCAFMPNGTPASICFFRGSAFGVSRKKNLQRSPIPALFGSATVRRPFRV